MRKSPLEMTLAERKSVLIQSCLIDMADMDYLTARWAYANGVFQTFYWSAAQCVEKHLKAALLYNDGSALGFRHDLKRLHAAVGELEPAFAAAVIAMPPTTGLGREAWEGKPMTLFVDYLHTFGAPDARYSLVGTYINGPVIHPLDALCAMTRALIRRRNFTGSDLFASSEAETWPDERMEMDRPWMIGGDLLLERLFARRYRVGHGEALRDTFRTMNFAFFEERAVDEATFGGLHSSMSPLLNHLLRLRDFDKSTENIRIIDELGEWADAHLQLPREVRAALRGKS